MGEPCESIPTTVTPTTRIPMGFLSRYCRQDHPEDPKRLAVIVATFALAVGYAGIAMAVVFQIFRSNGLGPGLVAALVATAGPLGAMVYGVHRKPDEPLAPGGDQ